MLHDVASGMMYLHSRRYVHGDLRSPNLFVTENGRVREHRRAQQTVLPAGRLSPPHAWDASGQLAVVFEHLLGHMTAALWTSALCSSRQLVQRCQQQLLMVMVTTTSISWVCCCCPLQVKIGDFGFTKRLKRSKETIKVGRITHPRWVAPEVC